MSVDETFRLVDKQDNSISVQSKHGRLSPVLTFQILTFFFFVFCNIFVTGIPVKFGLLGESTAATESRLPRTRGE
jgi:hypothetical protein